ncbi:MAG: hypothetical protein PVG30_02645 [Gammaproteobacteria bacterium]
MEIPKAIQTLKNSLNKPKNNETKNHIRIMLTSICCKVYIDASLKKFDPQAPKDMNSYYFKQALNYLNQITNPQLKAQKLIEFYERYNKIDLLFTLLTKPIDFKYFIHRAEFFIEKKVNLDIAFKYLKHTFDMKNKDKKLLYLLSYLGNDFNALGTVYYNKNSFKKAICCFKCAIQICPEKEKHNIKYNLTKTAKKADQKIGKYQRETQKFLKKLKQPKQKIPSDKKKKIKKPMKPTTRKHIIKKKKKKRPSSSNKIIPITNLQKSSKQEKNTYQPKKPSKKLDITSKNPLNTKEKIMKKKQKKQKKKRRIPPKIPKGPTSKKPNFFSNKKCNIKSKQDALTKDKIIPKKNYINNNKNLTLPSQKQINGGFNN